MSSSGLLWSCASQESKPALLLLRKALVWPHPGAGRAFMLLWVSVLVLGEYKCPTRDQGGTGTASLSTPGPALSWGSDVLSCEGRLFSGLPIQLRGFSLESEAVEGAGINLHPYREGNPVTTR